MEKEPTRALRFPLRLPLRYRAVAEGTWREGLTENISRSGVLFRAQDLLQVSTPVELSFRLSVALFTIFLFPFCIDFLSAFFETH